MFARLWSKSLQKKNAKNRNDPFILHLCKNSVLAFAYNHSFFIKTTLLKIKICLSNYNPALQLCFISQSSDHPP